MGAVVAVVVAVSAMRGGDGPEPLGGPPIVGFQAVPMRHGDPMTLGALFLDNPDGADVEIVDVEVNRTANLEVLGVRALYPVPDRYGGTSSDSTFPPANVATVPAYGHRFEGRDVPRDGERDVDVEVFVGVTLTSGDVGGLNGIRVTYELDDVRHEQVFPYALLIPLAGTDADEGLFDDLDQTLTHLGLLAPEDGVSGAGPPP